MVLPAPSIDPDDALFILRASSPAIVLLAALSLPFLSPPTSPPAEPSPITPVVIASRVPRRSLLLTLISLASLTYLADGLALAVYAVLNKHWPRSNGIIVNAIAGLVAFSALAAFGTWKEHQGVSVWFFHRVRLALSLAFILDVTLATLLGFRIKSLFSDPADVPLSVLLHFAFPVLRVLIFVPLLVALFSPHTVYTTVQPNGHVEDVPSDASALLAPTPRLATSLSPNDATKYGTFRSIQRSDLQPSVPTTRAPTPFHGTVHEAKTNVKPEITLEPSWSELWRRIRRITPYLWPSKDRYLQLLASLCIIVLLLGRIVNVAMPFVLAQLIRVLDHPDQQSPWPYLFVYVALRFLQGSGGLAAVRDSLWAPVMQYSDREMSQLSFDHLLNLSFSWHLRRKTGEILRVLDRGAAINRTLELILFNLIPTFIDIIVALVAFSVFLEWTLTVVIAFVMFAYVAASVILTRWRTRIKRQMNERDVITRGIHTDCLLNYETVKYFGGEEHEGERYRDAIRRYQGLEYKVILSLNFLNIVQNALISLGLLIGSIIVASRVTKDLSDPGDFVLFITYLAQLYGPLNQLGYVYRSMNTSLIDTEKLLDLLNESTDVNDRPGAPDLTVTDGEIEFDNVNFSYDGRTTALKGVSFKVPKGSSVALVGESGSGKSTILRLLYRFYDLSEGEGRILIDGQDIRDVTQKSLRNAIGVVPQDSILFNASIGYNIGYGKFGASPDEIEAAAKSAQMHDKILTFSDGYDTNVGERGVRLSGGEKQRVAIARTLLKNPPVLLLDEATSALDTATEKDIQKALQNLVRGRSSLSIAHRLSTIATADLILVLKEGQIVEQGTHKELLAHEGLFAAMWAEQVSAMDELVEDHKEISGYDVEPQAVIEASTVSQPVEVIELEPEPVSSINAERVVVSELSAQPLVLLTSVDKTLPPTPLETPVVPLSSGSVAFPTSSPVAFPTSGSVAFPTSSSPVAFPTSPTPAPVAFPTSDPEQETVGPTSVTHGDAANCHSIAPSAPSTAPLAFPTTDETDQIPTPGPAVTFEDSVNSAPRNDTPDTETGTKRRRTASQNFQRLARRISITARRQSSIIPGIPGLNKKSDSPRVSLDETANNDGSSTTGGSLKGDTLPRGENLLRGDTIKNLFKKGKKDKEQQEP